MDTFQKCVSCSDISRKRLTKPGKDATLVLMIMKRFML